MTSSIREQLKQLAKDNNLSVKDLIALTQQNDPFYVGSDAQVRDGNWFAEEWYKRYPTVDHVPQAGENLRSFHYFLQSSGTVQLPKQINWKTNVGGRKITKSTDVYINNQASWRYLCVAAKSARYLGLVDPSHFRDAKSGELLQNATYPPLPEDWKYDENRHVIRPQIIGGWSSDEDVESWEDSDDKLYNLPELPELEELPEELPSGPVLSSTGFHTEQKYVIEIWTEKSGVVPIIESFAKTNNINIVVGQGEISITTCLKFIERAKRYNKPVLVLYLADYDPAGVNMSKAAARKIEYFIALNQDEEINVQLVPVVLTEKQIKEYNLPTVPAKDEDVRKSQWDEKHGVDSVVELDSLEALHPGILVDLFKEYIERHTDHDYYWTVQDTKRVYEQELQNASEDSQSYHSYTIRDLSEDYRTLVSEWNNTREEFAEMIAPFQDKIDQYNERFETIKQEIKAEYEELSKLISIDSQSVTVPQQPEHNLPLEEKDIKLFDSKRDYVTQLKYYTAYKATSTVDHLE